MSLVDRLLRRERLPTVIESFSMIEQEVLEQAYWASVIDNYAANIAWQVALQRANMGIEFDYKLLEQDVVQASSRLVNRGFVENVEGENFPNVTPGGLEAWLRIRRVPWRQRLAGTSIKVAA